MNGVVERSGRDLLACGLDKSRDPVVDELLTTVAEFRVGASEADLWLLGVTRGKGRMRVTSAHRFGTSQPRHVTGSVKRSFAPHES